MREAPANRQTTAPGLKVKRSLVELLVGVFPYIYAIYMLYLYMSRVYIYIIVHYVLYIVPYVNPYIYIYKYVCVCNTWYTCAYVCSTCIYHFMYMLDGWYIRNVNQDDDKSGYHVTYQYLSILI